MQVNYVTISVQFILETGVMAQFSQLQACIKWHLPCLSHVVIAGDMSHVEKEIKRSIMESFKKTDEDFLKRAASCKPSWKDGTTAVIVVAINNTLYIANLGDSKVTGIHHIFTK